MSAGVASAAAPIGLQEPANVSVASAPTVDPGGLAEVAGDVDVLAPPGGILQKGMDFRIELQDASNQNCTAPDQIVGFANAPAAQATDNAVPVITGSDQDPRCPAGVLTSYYFALRAPTRDLRISNIRYTIGTATPAGSISVVVTEVCGAKSCVIPTCLSAGGCVNAVVARPALAIAAIDPTVSADLATLQVVVHVTNAGDAISPGTEVEVSAPGWVPAEGDLDRIFPTGSGSASVVLDVPASALGTEVVLTAAVDPDGEILQGPNAVPTEAFKVPILSRPLPPPTTSSTSEPTTSSTSEPTTSSTTEPTTTSTSEPTTSSTKKHTTSTTTTLPLIIVPPPPPPPRSSPWEGIVAVLGLVVVGAGAARWYRRRGLPPNWGAESVRLVDVRYGWKGMELR